MTAPKPFSSASDRTTEAATASCTATPTDLKKVISSSDCRPCLSPLMISPISAWISAFGMIRSPASTKQSSRESTATRSARRIVVVSTSRFSGTNVPTAVICVPCCRSFPSKSGVAEVVAHKTISAPTTTCFE